MSRSTPKTILLQKRIGSVSDALSHFRTDDANQLPIVLIPDDRAICSCFMTVPSGPHCIMHRWGKDVNEASLEPAGLKTCYPACNKIAYCVTAAACNYNAPVKSCPTADNVMVDCDLTLIFEIGPEAHDVKKFCYLLGARRFDEFLYAAVEEAIRHLIRTCVHTQIYELKGGPALEHTRTELNKKFDRFGVRFRNLAITDVQFKKELGDTLEQTTEFKSKIQEQSKKQKNAMQAIDNKKAAEMQELDQSNRRIIQDLQAKRNRIEIDRAKRQTEELSRAEVMITEAKQRANVAEVEAQSEKNTTLGEGQKDVQLQLGRVRSNNDSARIKVAQECKNAIFESDQKKTAARLLANALIVEAQAEEGAASSLKVKREHELRMAKLEVLQAIAQNNKIVISGAQGDRLIGELMDSSILGEIMM